MTTKVSLLLFFGVCTWCVLEYGDELGLLCLCCFLLMHSKDDNELGSSSSSFFEDSIENNDGLRLVVVFCCFLLSCKKTTMSLGSLLLFFLQIPQKTTTSLGSSLSFYFLLMMSFYWNNANNNKLAMLVVLFFWLHCHRRQRRVGQTHCHLHLFWLVANDKEPIWLIIVFFCYVVENDNKLIKFIVVFSCVDVLYMMMNQLGSLSSSFLLMGYRWWQAKLIHYCLLLCWCITDDDELVKLILVFFHCSTHRWQVSI